MRALVLARYGDAHRAFELHEVPDPIPAEDEVLIESEYSGVNYADVMARLGVYPDAPRPPAVLGYEVVGRIQKLNDRVAEQRPDLKIGQRVVALTRFGGYASLVRAKALAVLPLSEDADGAEATALATQGVTAYLAAEECVRLHPGNQVLIHAAAGGVGLLLVQLAKRRGCRIFATAGSREKVELLRDELGVDHAIAYRELDFFSEIQRISGQSQPLDVVFDSIGGRNFYRSKRLLSPGGKMVSYGVASVSSRGIFRSLQGIRMAIGFGLFHPLSLLDRSQAVIGLNVLRIADHHPDLLAQAFSEISGLVRSQEIKLRVGATFPIREVGAAHQLLESRQSMGKIVLRW